MEPLYTLLSTLRSLDPETLDQEYNAVRSQTNVLKRDLGLTTEAGALQENIKKNRYKDVLPYDQSRVVLSLSVTNCDSDYINASFIQGATAGHSYIASQGPLSSTVIDFWRMIWQYDIKVIVMACREIEMGKKKCQCYWAPVNQSATFGPFTVCNEEESSACEELVVRNLTVAFQQDNRSLVQYQFLSWPDHDVPYEPERVVDLLVQARNSQGTHTSPLLIHCSAGCGRTGVICALDYIHDLLVTKEITSDFSIKKIVLELRKQRPAAVQTKDQYHFIFKVVISMFERFLQSTRDPLFSNMSEKSEEKTTRAPASTSSRLSQTNMNATYAVVNKPKHQPSPIPAYSTVATPKTNPAIRTPPSSHHYDNDPVAAPVYSTVKPRAKHSAAPIYTAPHSHVNGEAPLTLVNNAGYGLTSAEASSLTDDDYEDVSSSDTTNLCSPGVIGFNCRVQKPRGPRDPPAEWSQLER